MTKGVRKVLGLALVILLGSGSSPIAALERARPADHSTTTAWLAAGTVRSVAGSVIRARKVSALATVPHVYRANMMRARARWAIANPFGQSLLGIVAGGGIANEKSRMFRRDLDVDCATGARWVRIDINWASIQYRGASRYYWRSTDRVVRRARACGMNVLGALNFTPSWARPRGTDATYAPDPIRFATFARASVRHYAALGVLAYEIWNEPNLANAWKPAPNPRAYTALLKAAYTAIKQADPSATVVTGGLSPGLTTGANWSAQDFLARIYAYGGKGYFDAVGEHPYCWPAWPGERNNGSAWFGMYGTRPSVRSVMTSHGDGAKLIWGTEFGAPTSGPRGSYVSQSIQARMLTRAYRLWARYRWAGPLFFYEGRDGGTNAGSYFNFFGMLRHNFVPKPAYAAYRQVARALRLAP